MSFPEKLPTAYLGVALLAQEIYLCRWWSEPGGQIRERRDLIHQKKSKGGRKVPRWLAMLEQLAQGHPQTYSRRFRVQYERIDLLLTELNKLAGTDFHLVLVLTSERVLLVFLVGG